jgi:peptidoglycan/LPS O-acetylase OafA/YrhL
MLSHFGLKVVPGLFGVTIFFFISGYLITTQLLGEIGRTGTIELGNFYMRRLLRLYPALLVAITLGAGAYALLGGRLTDTDVFSAVFYFSNYNDWFGGNQTGLPNLAHPFTVLWSLAVEEHYYVVFPLLALLCARSRARFVGVIALAILVITAWRTDIALACHADALGCVDMAQLRIEHGSDTRADSILYGALMAALLASSWRDKLLAVLRRRLSLVIGLALVLTAFVIRDGLFRDTVRYSVQGVGLFLCIGALLFDERLAVLKRIAAWRWVVLVGRWSYSLYLWHWMVRVVMGQLAPSWMWEPIVNPWIPPVSWLLTVLPGLMMMSFGAAILSYYYVERPMLAVRRRFGSHTVADTAPAFGPAPAQGLA